MVYSYERIMDELGEVNYYVHEKLNKPLVVTDDDIAGTFTFLRALPDYSNRRDLTPAQIKELLQSTALDLGYRANIQGSGRADLHRALLAQPSPARPRGCLLSPLSLLAQLSRWS